MFKIKSLTIAAACLVLSNYLHSMDIEKNYDRRLFSENIDDVKAAIATGADFNAQNECDNTPLIMAAGQHESVEITKLLIETGADLNRSDSSCGHTPLIWAAFFNHIEIATLLIKAGADLYTKDKQGYTALDYAEAKNHSEIVKLIEDRINLELTVSKCLSDAPNQILPPMITNIINSYL